MKWPSSRIMLSPRFFSRASCRAVSSEEYRRNRSGAKPPPRMTTFLPLTLYCRTPSGATEDLPTSAEVTVRIPKVSVVVSSTVLPCATEVSNVYSGDEPIWYGHQTAGLAIVRAGNADGVNVTVLVLCALTVADWDTVIGVPPPGGVMIALTVPVCDEPELLVTSVFTVMAELDRSLALASDTCALPSD